MLRSILQFLTKTAPEIESIATEVKARIVALEQKTKQEGEMDSSDATPAPLKRAGTPATGLLSSKSSEQVPPRVRRSNTATGTPSGSTTSVTASTADSAPVAENSAPAPTKKKKRVGVRFQEQKRFYFYDEDSATTNTSKVSSGFTSVPGVNDDSFEPLVRELIRVALVPVSTSHAPFPEKQILKYIQSAFSIYDDEMHRLVEDERASWDIYALISALIARLKTLDQHIFYSPQSFRSEEEFQMWQTLEAKRISTLIERLKLLVPDYDEKCPDGTTSPRNSRNKPLRTKSKSGIEDSTTSNASASASAGGKSSSISKPAKKSKNKGDATTNNAAAGGGGAKIEKNSPEATRSKSGKSGKSGTNKPNPAHFLSSMEGSTATAKAAAPGATPGAHNPLSSPDTLGDNSTESMTPDYDHKSDKDTKGRKNTPYKAPVPPAAAAAAAAASANAAQSTNSSPNSAKKDDDSSEESKDATTTSESVDRPPSSWSGRGPRVAIRPLQFIGEDSTDDDKIPSGGGGGNGSQLEGLSPKGGSARRPSIFSASSDVGEDSEDRLDYSGSDPETSPRRGSSGAQVGATSAGEDTGDELPDNSDEGGQPRGAIRIVRKPRSSSGSNKNAASGIQRPKGHDEDSAFADGLEEMEDSQAEFAEKPDDYDPNDNSTEYDKQEVSMAPTPFEVLFRTLIQYETSDLRKQEKRIEAIIPLLDKAHVAISSQFSLDRHVNMFDALPELNPDAFVSGFTGFNFLLNHPDTTVPAAPLTSSNASISSATASTAANSPNLSRKSTATPSTKRSKTKEKERSRIAAEPHPWVVPLWDAASEQERILFGVSNVGRWLLGEYAFFWGYSPLYQNLVQLNHLVSFLMPSADMLLMLYVLMTRVLDLLQAEDLEPIPSALETYYFAQLMRDLNHDAESAFYNMFGQFSYEDLAALKMLLNILSLIYECNEYLGEAPPKTYKAYLEQALEESVRNYYTEVVTDAEEPREMSGDPVGTNTSSAVRKRQRSERRTTANQLLAACFAMDELLTNLGPFQELFHGLSKPLFDICCKAYIRQLFSDTSLFVIKLARTQPVERVLALANGVIKINQLCTENARSEIIEPLPVEKLFGSFLYDWLVQTEVAMKGWANTTCKIERWSPVDAAKGKLWSACSWDLYKLVLSHIPFVLDNETLFKLTVAAEEAELAEGGTSWTSAGSPVAGGPHRDSSARNLNAHARMSHKAIGFTAESITERKKTYFYQYALGTSRVLRDFVENVYNLFVEEFPADLHSDLHDLYIRDYYNMTTGGSGLHLMYKKKKKSIFAWLTGRKKTEASSSDDSSRHANLATSTSQPKLGKKKSTAALTVSAPSTLPGAKASTSSPDLHRSQSSNENEDSGGDGDSPRTGFNSARGTPTNGPFGGSSSAPGFFSPSGAGLMSSYQSAGIDHNDDPSRELIINVWSMIVFDPKRVVKMRKLRKRIDIKQSMCIKLNDLDALRAFFDRLLQGEPLFSLAVNPAFVLMHKVFRTFLHMIIYIINMHLDTEMEHIFKKCSSKKPSSSVYEAHINFISNFSDQLALMKENLRNNIFKRVLLRLWKVIQEDMAELLNPEDDDSSKTRTGPTALQIAALEALLDSVKPILSGYGMSGNHINSKISELLGPHRDAISADELERAKALYEAEKAKFLHKEKKKKGLNASAGALGHSSSAANLKPSEPSSGRRHVKENSADARLGTSSSVSKPTTGSGVPRDGSGLNTGTSLRDSSTTLPNSSRKHSESISVSSSSTVGLSGATTPASTPSTRRGTTGEGAPISAVPRRMELNHQESASSFVREAPLTESSEEADAYNSHMKLQIPHGSDSEPSEETVKEVPPKKPKKPAHLKKEKESTSTTPTEAPQPPRKPKKDVPATE